MPTIQYHAIVRDKQQTDHRYVVSGGMLNPKPYSLVMAGR
jgi:hypothetical protein